MVKTISQIQKRHIQHYVVSTGLIHHFLSQFHLWLFTLHNHLWRSIGSIHEDVASARHLIKRYAALHLHHLSRIAHRVFQSMHHMLSHPLLWGQGYPSPAHHVPDFDVAAGFPQRQVAGRQIQLGIVINIRHRLRRQIHLQAEVWSLVRC